VKATSPPPHRRVLALAALIGVVAATLVALALPATAMATVCGDKVLADWFDNGRIDRLYDGHCYEDAIDAIPSDLRDYANAEEVIFRALQASLRGELDPGGRDPSPDDPGGLGSPPSDPGDPDGDGDGAVAAPDVDTTGLSSVPIPLLVLGAMSLALLGAGGLGYLRRRHATDDLDGPDDDLDGPDDHLAV
jgi:hypothetical protein